MSELVSCLYYLFNLFNKIKYLLILICLNLLIDLNS